MMTRRVDHMKKFALIATIVVCGPMGLAAAPLSLPRSTPESQGVSSPGILAFVTKADQTIDAMHSVMVVRHGHVVAEGWWAPYDAAARHSLYSLSKSFTSTAVGLAVAEGKLSVDDRVLSFFPDDAPAAPSDHLKAMRISDLLRMSTGHQAEPNLGPLLPQRKASSPGNESPWTKTFLAQPVPNKPGTHFMYNTPATYMLSAIVQKTMGITVLDYLKPRLFDPLGIEDPTWGTSPQGVSLGGYGLSVRTEDLAKFGQLYLQKGKWQGTQLVPAAWIEAATARQTSNGSNPSSDWEQGYGYQFWRCRHGAFRGDGAFGQYCLVLPEQDAVIAITSSVKDMQAVLNLVWDQLLPALKPTPLAADRAAAETLERTLKALSMRPQQGSGSSGAGAKVAGTKYQFPTNDRELEAITLERDSKTDAVTLVMRSNGVDQRIACGRGEWRKGRLAFGPLAEQPAAVSGDWTDDDTYKAKIAFYETPFMATIRLKFSEGELLFDSESNVAFGPTKSPRLVGRAD
ncbi:CubicO group peptidase, beta-lactamase class C family [Singulisphaera sp. GP187]|uniref:serine hydrolase domain-containing protein n=1 Tax=Singulisphaera sp. GP187 TaxID=1882752 RepID=UPI0009267400|nr:serine hydrolase [Singulisphaera sp. GP187]SIO62550.1 CubicO group peptidase, beta-lactamase class C family [Singulisphaera sp. GP187]